MFDLNKGNWIARRLSWRFGKPNAYTLAAAALPAVAGWLIEGYTAWSGMSEPLIGWAAVLHSLLCVAWWTQGQMRDIVVDRYLSRARRAQTVTGWIANRYGLAAIRHVPAACFLLAAFFGTVATLETAHVFFLSVLCGLLGAIRCWTVNLNRRSSVQRGLVKTILMTLAHGMLLTIWIACV
ncbi:hypothetical protein [Tumebacillus permanentifrigoris]|uniref:UbiA prenyltransferase family protein n=1 Tax=Tumebacillus permanentifrigoris TaxID=378543 RepID=A0A316D2M8_9BACL|nr:hypothetical protein [Tumebacillus permanentifrigoris]PWK05134.1 hypothetical protein C7459_1264 [Tumebacillus permanentifrigoris]